MDGACAVCSKQASQRCSVCRAVNYCSRDHQKQHWKVHKNECRCYQIATSEKLGRYMVAARNIAAGEVILREPPLVYGPKVSSFPQCLGCHRNLTGSSPDDETPKSFYCCSKCNWPMCSPRCEKSPVHQAECAIMAKSKHKMRIKCQEEPQKDPAYCTIVPLRCLLLKHEKLNEVLSLASNLESLINTPLYNIFKINIVGFFHQALGLTQFDEETILKVAAVLDTNAFEVRREKDIRIRGLYPKAAMMSHNCRANTKHIFVGDDFSIVIMATTDIKKGEIICATYTQSLWSTQERRQHLKMSKCFDCDCTRCMDPTEFDTYFSCILCSKCNKGYMLCENPLLLSSNWKCQNCSHIIKAKQMAFGNDALKRELENTGKTIPTLEAILDKYLKDDKSVLHPTNCHIIQAKHALIQLYGTKLADLDTDKLDYAESLCHDLLELAEKLDPGITRFRGTLLYDLQAIKVIKVKAEFEKDLITKEKAQELLAEVAQLLQEATVILKSEPDMVDLLEERVKELSELCSD